MAARASSPDKRPDDRIAGLEAENRRLSEALERVGAERDWLAESEAMHRAAAELNGWLAWSMDATGQVLAMSRMFTPLLGFSDEQDLDGDWRRLIHPDDRERVSAEWAKAYESGRPFVSEFRACFASGTVRRARARAVPVRDADGAILRWYGSAEDVHEHYMAEEARRDVEERYRLAARATNDAVWDYDLANVVIQWGENAATILGHAELRIGHTPGLWWNERIHPDDRDQVVKSFNHALESGARRWSATYRFQRGDGSYADILDRGFIIRDAAGAPIRAVGAMADLTERLRAEAEIRRMQAELVHVSRLSAMGTMASTLAHELNQPLAALGNFISGAKRLAERSGDQPALLDALRSAESGAQRAAEIVRRLRELVSRGKVSVVVEHLPKLIEDASVLAFVDERVLGVRHGLDLDPAAEWVRADRVQIQQVIINLVRNAIEAMERSAQREILISTRVAEEGMVEIAVADTGPGIPPDRIDELFSQFMTTKSGGMGIGLPISRTIVEAHGGLIWAENRPEGGAVFRFTLPHARRRDGPAV